MTESDVLQFAGDPIRYFGYSRAAMHALPQRELEALQLAALRERYAALIPRLPVLATMAAEQGVDGIGALHDAAPLLFPHTVYKSYPASLLRDLRFDKLTTWLSRLVTADLSGLDTSGCDSIDSWLDLLDAQTPLRLAHSSGTSGTMSFFPHSAGQFAKLYEIVRLEALPGCDAEGLDVIWPSYRFGRSGIARHATAMEEQISGSPERFHALYPGSLSADVMYLAGQLRAAARLGRTDQLEISPALRERRAELEEAQRSAAAGFGEFAQYLADTLRGKRVVSLALWDQYYSLASAALDRGLSGLFAADSMFLPGGGTKGGVLPGDWDRQVAEFAGIPRVQLIYAMVEVISVNLLCPRDGYHMEPWVILYVLDRDTGQPLPRQGKQRGRAAFYDLTADLYWGGSVSGDEISVDWSPCPCGRQTPRVGMDIGRFADRDGDDKITCAATPDALDDALDFLTGALA